VKTTLGMSLEALEPSNLSPPRERETPDRLADSVIGRGRLPTSLPTP